MTVLARIRERANQQAAISEDMNEATTGGSRLIPGGAYVGRLCEYVDLGMQPEEFQGQAKAPCPQIRMGVALFGENIQDEDGRPFILRSSSMSVKRNERSNAYKAFQAMNYKQDPNIKHFAQFIGEPFIFTVEVRTAKKSQRQYNSIVWDKTSPAINVMTGQPYDVPQVPDDMYRVFLWDYPTLEDWDALHIDGTRDDGTSMNFIQETILGALNFQGSPLQLLLEAGGLGIQESPAVAQSQAPQGVPAAQAPAAPVAAPVAPTTPVTTPAAAPAPVAPVLPSIPGQPAAVA